LELEIELWNKHWNFETWKEYLCEPGAEADAEAIRQCTHTGRPLGTAEFIETVEKTVGRILSPQKGGRPPKLPNHKQELFSFD
jgi:plasmid stabilization system protein ParE